MEDPDGALNTETRKEGKFEKKGKKGNRWKGKSRRT